MSRLRLVGRLVARDLRRRPGQAVLMLLAITAATATLTLGLVLHGVTSQPYQQTRAATRGPDEVAYLGPPPASGGPRAPRARHRDEAAEAGPDPGRDAGPGAGGDRFERALPARGRPGPGQRPHRGGGGRGAGRGAGNGRPAQADRGELGAARRGRARADLRRGARRRRGRPDHAERPAVHRRRDRGHRGQPAVPEPVLLLRRRLPGRAARPRLGPRHRAALAHQARRPRPGHAGQPGDHVRGGPEAEGPGHGGRVRPALRPRTSGRRR